MAPGEECATEQKPLHSCRKDSLVARLSFNPQGQVQVDDGATTIIGGIFVSQEQISNERTPVLYRLPLLGWLFKRDTTSDESRELLIFITPRIIRG